MLQAASSWLITTLPLLDFDCDHSEVTRCGNEHRKFIPVNAYPTADGFVFVAIGNDVQWQRITEMEHFSSLRTETRATNAGRIAEQKAIHAEMAEATRQYSSAALMEELARRKIPHAPINTIRQVREMEAISSRLTTTHTPDGRVVHLPPMATDLEDGVSELSFAPSYSQHTRPVLAECGLGEGEIAALSEDSIIP
jgi:crotonobetainyl-CoA:carnitine CoA-transferase CaiB-like acyl-CoA transferase